MVVSFIKKEREAVVHYSSYNKEVYTSTAKKNFRIGNPYQDLSSESIKFLNRFSSVFQSDSKQFFFLVR